MRVSLQDIFDSSSEDEEDDITQITSIEDGVTTKENLHYIKDAMDKEADTTAVVDDELSDFLDNVLQIDKKNIPRYESPRLDFKNKFQNNVIIPLDDTPMNGKTQQSQQQQQQQPTGASSELVVSNVAEHDDNKSGVRIPFMSSLLSNMDLIKESSATAIKTVRLEKKRREEEELKRIEEERKRKEEQKRKEEELKKRIEAEKARAAEEKIRLEKEQALKKAEEEKLKLLKEKEEAEKKQKEEALAKEKAELLLKEESKSSVGVYKPNSIESQFNQYKQRIIDIKQQIVLAASNDKQLKSILSKHKRKINPKFGQLTNSMAQLQTIVSGLVELINETKSSELAYKWILNFISKAIVSQAETEVAVKPESALPLAKLALNLMCVYPELLPDFLLPRFVKKCPLVIGYTCSVETEEGRLRMGWKRKSDGKWEDDSKYNERLSGISTLYCTITRLQVSDVNSMVHPLPMSKAWNMISRIANTPKELLTDIHFSILGAFWESCGQFFNQCYGNQGAKLLTLISTDLTNLVSDMKYVAAARLRILAETWQTSGSIQTFPEMGP